MQNPIGHTILMTASTEELKDEALYRELFSYLPPVRQEKTSRIKIASAREESLGAGILLIYMLVKAGMDPSSLIPDIGSCGKPFFKNAPDLHFNISHTDGRVLCVLSDRPVGCDVEILKKEQPNIVKRFYAPAEQAIMAELADPEERRRMFYRIWTLKESYIKAIGTGFHTEPETYAVIPPRILSGNLNSAGKSDSVSGGNERHYPYLCEDPERFYFQEYEDKDYCLALCLDGRPEENAALESITFTEIRKFLRNR